MFWNDPKYEKARELLATKKSGEMLQHNMREDLVEAREAMAR
jgi:hypothetical protein